MDFDYPFANLPSALVRTAVACLLPAILRQPSLTGWTSGVAARIFEGTCPNRGLTI